MKNATLLILLANFLLASQAFAQLNLVENYTYKSCEYCGHHFEMSVRRKTNSDTAYIFSVLQESKTETSKDSKLIRFQIETSKTTPLVPVLTKTIDNTEGNKYICSYEDLENGSYLVICHTEEQRIEILIQTKPLKTTAGSMGGKNDQNQSVIVGFRYRTYHIEKQEIKQLIPEAWLECHHLRVIDNE